MGFQPRQSIADDELFVKNYAEYTALVVRNTLLRTKEYATNTAVLGPAGTTNLVNVDPLFLKTSLTSSTPDYRLRDASPAATRPRTPSGSVPPRDLLNLPRNAASPTLGAYEHK